MKQHKWHDVIVAIAKGIEVERNWNKFGWELFDQEKHVSPIDPYNSEMLEWRIKPQPQEPTYLYVFKENMGRIFFKNNNGKTLNSKCIGKIKLEVDDA